MTIPPRTPHYDQLPSDMLATLYRLYSVTGSGKLYEAYARGLFGQLRMVRDLIRMGRSHVPSGQDRARLDVIEAYISGQRPLALGR